MIESLLLATIFLIIAISAILLTAFLVILIFDSLRLEVSFYPTDKDSLAEIVDFFEITNQSTLIDLGCGDGRVLREVKKSHPQTRLIGIEKGIIPYLLLIFSSHGKNIEIRFKDIRKVNLVEATHIYCFLSLEMNEVVAKKFMEECKPGTKLFTSDFKMNSLKLLGSKKINQSNGPLSKEIYLYIK